MPFFGTTSTAAPFASAASNWICSPTMTQTATSVLGSYCATSTTCTTQLVANTQTTWIFYSDPMASATALAVVGGGQCISEIVVDEQDLVNHAEYFELARQRGIAFRIRTAEEKRLAAEAAERARVAAEQLAREREAADLRARELLFKHLTAEQRRTVEKNKWFVVVGGKSGTEYRIRTDYGVAGNISVMRGERVEATLCCHCSSDIPNCDQFLAQKLALQWDEEGFLKTANRRAA